MRREFMHKTCGSRLNEKLIKAKWHGRLLGCAPRTYNMFFCLSIGCAPTSSNIDADDFTNILIDFIRFEWRFVLQLLWLFRYH